MEVCPQCNVAPNTANCRLIRDACGHVKCRLCLVQEEDGCTTCAESGVNALLVRHDHGDLAGSSNFEELLPMSWDVNSTKLLIDCYKKYKKDVGTSKIKTMKKMWKMISEELSLVLRKKITEGHCENRWRVLDRNYRKYINAKNSTGSGRRHFEYASELDDLYGHGGSVHLEDLLSPDAAVLPEPAPIKEEVVTETSPVTTLEDLSKNERRILMKKISALKQIRKDRLEYHRKRLEQENNKLALFKERVQLAKETLRVLKGKVAL